MLAGRRVVWSPDWPESRSGELDPTHGKACHRKDGVSKKGRQILDYTAQTVDCTGQKKKQDTDMGR